MRPRDLVIYAAILAAGAAQFVFLPFLLFLPIRLSYHYGAALILPAATTLAFALGAVESRGREGGGWKRSLRAGGIVILAAHLWTAIGFLRYVHAKGGGAGEYGLALRLKRSHVEAVNPAKARRFFATYPGEYHYLLERREAGK